MSGPIRVLHIIDSLRYGGAETLLFELASRLDSHGFRPIVYYCEPGPLVDDFKNKNIPVTHLPWIARIDPILLVRMYNAIRKEKPQIVHTHLFKSDFHGRLAARLAGVPIVVSTLHNCNAWARNPLFGLIYGFTTKFADRIIAVADEVRDYVIRYFRILPEKVITIPNAVSIERFEGKSKEGLALRKEFDISHDAPLLGIVGRLEPQKDHENYLHAAVRIHKNNQDARFLIVGEGYLRDRLIALANSLDLKEVVIFCGSRKDIPAVMAALDILVISSSYEGLPVVLLEAMAASRPIVSTAVSGVLSVVEDGVTGILVDPSNSNALADACLRLIGNPELRKKMGQNGYERVKTYYSVNAMTEKTVMLYKELISTRGVAA
jgi:glycosyltransferase involved in cell wall biosynthesis